MTGRVRGIAGLVLALGYALFFAGCAPFDGGAPRPSPRPALPVRLVDGALGRFDSGSQRYVPLTRGAGIEIGIPLQSGEADAVLHLAGGGTVVAAPHASFTRLDPSEDSGFRIRVDEGRLWLHLKAEEQVEVSSFRTRTVFGDGDAEVFVYKDRDRFLNTEVRMWSGRATVRGGDRLAVERLLTDGIAVHVDDTRVHLAARFDRGRPDAWQARMRRLP